MLITMPALDSKHIILRELRADDIPRIVELANDYDVSINTTNIPFPYTDNDAIYWINMGIEGRKNDSAYVFAIELKANNTFIGGIGLHVNKRFSRAEAGYWLGKAYWNKGYATEALQTAIQFGFHNLKLNKVTASHFADNISSGRVMQKCGMNQEGVLKQHLQRGGNFKDLVCYGLTADKFWGSSA